MTGTHRLLAMAALLLAPWMASAHTSEGNQPVQATHGMVASAQHYASEIGADILRRGGNAVDAAVAVGYALAVVHPCCGNIGGGGFATLHFAAGPHAGQDRFIDFREKAPLAATADMFLDRHGDIVPRLSLDGYKAVAVPGTVMGLDTMLRRYGTMSRAQVMAPAIELAEKGYVLVQGDVDILDLATRRFAQDKNVAGIFLDHGRPWKVGGRIKQPELAASLRLIEEQGADAFYKGPIAAAIVAASKADGGILQLKDLASYTVADTAPITCAYHGYRVVSAPPPSSGGTTLCEILGVLAPYHLETMPFHAAEPVHLMVEAMRRAYLDRNFRLGDPDFVSNPVAALLSPAHERDIRRAILPGRATPSSTLKPGQPLHEGNETTHVSIVDAQGNAVSMTYTINALLGAKVIAGHTGFFLNDEMDDFSAKPMAPNLFGLVQGTPDKIEPGKRPLSSMSPTIVMKDGQVFMVIGSPGGSRIITITLEAMLNVIDHHMNIAQAIDAPRLHHQWLPDIVEIESGALSDKATAELETMGYDIEDHGQWGDAEGIVVGRNHAGARVLFGANDDRRPAGAAAGY
ncbi:MAG TPA: gamma-glutamyltransferase [Stellaceae bacterium]|nr:gamma-glutamyltransferase [Stellaceae bacterium]